MGGYYINSSKIMAKRIKKKILPNLSKATAAEVAKAFSKHIDLLSTVGSHVTPSWLSTELPSLDKALGIGGLPIGRIVELYGPEAVGKTSLCLHFVACAQKAKGRACYIDAEHALDLKMAQYIGVDVDNLLFSQPDSSAEDILELIRNLFKTKAVDILVVDSLAALVPKSREEKSLGKREIADMPRLMSDSLRIIQRTVKRANGILIFVNQTRSKIGVMFGNPETTTGGNALKFYAGVRMRLSRVGPVEKGKRIVGMYSKVNIVKNKVAPPFKTCVIRVMYGKGWTDALEE